MSNQNSPNLAFALEVKVAECSKALRAFRKGHLGLTPDAVKSTPEWKSAKSAYNQAFEELRSYNVSHMKRR